MPKFKVTVTARADIEETWIVEAEDRAAALSVETDYLTTGHFVEDRVLGGEEDREISEAVPYVEPPEAPSGPLSSADYELIADALDILDPDGSADTRRKQELESYFRQMAATGQGYLNGRPAPRVLVRLEGGMVQGCLSDYPTRLIVVDYDTEGAATRDLHAIPQDGGGTANAILSPWDPEIGQDWIDAAENAKPAEGK